MLIVLYGLIKKVNVFNAFVEGAKQGAYTLVSILPTLCAVFFVIGIFRESGACDVSGFALNPFARILNLPSQLAPLMILRPLSGSGALAYFKTAVGMYGADSMISRIGAVMLGSSETTFYTVSVYYGAAGVKKTSYTLPCALIGDFAAFAAAGLIVPLFFK